MIKRFAPVATPVTFKELLATGLKIFGNDEDIKEFEGFFSKRIGVRHSFALSSGRAGLYVILKTLKRMSKKREVIIPAYTCPSVAASVVKAGLKVVLCDISTSGFDYNIDMLSKLMGEDTLAVVCVHLFGIPADIGEILKMASGKDIFVIEDAAQFAAEANNSKNPLKGDFAFYSLGRGKNITAGGGGVIATNNDKYAREIVTTLIECKRTEIRDSLRIFLKIFFYYIFVNPLLYFIPQNLPFLKLGETIYSTNFDIERFTPAQSRLGVLMLNKLDKVNADRRKKGLSFYERLKGINSVSLINDANGDALYLRFPVFVKDEKKRDKIYEELKKKGLGVSKMYPEPLNKIKPLLNHIEKIREYPNAEKVARQLLTLPTHYGIKDDDIDSIVIIIKRHIGTGNFNEN